MNKIGILTFTYGNNFGQRLQNLAVQEILRDMGFDVCTIPQRKNLNYKIQSIKKNLRDLYTRSYIISITRKRLFDEFNRENIVFYSKKISEKKMNSFPEKEFDFFVVGSDQIWSPYSKDVNATFFLRFTTCNKRIALAPSLASEDIPQKLLPQYREYLNGFRCLSVREEKSSNLLQSYFGLKAEVLIDPTLMFSAQFWGKYERKPKWLKNNQYIVFYYLGSADYTKKVPLEYRNITVIELMPGTRYWASGPAEFLYLIHHAKLVITDSYHGCIFSLIFDTPLIIQKRHGDTIDMTSRFETLYHKFNLNIDIDSGVVLTSDLKKNLIYEQDKFRNFLKKALL